MAANSGEAIYGNRDSPARRFVELERLAIYQNAAAVGRYAQANSHDTLSRIWLGQCFENRSQL